jgi:hypothetical protein
MRPKHPVLDVLITREGGAWRLHVAPFSWKPGLLRLHMNDRGQVFPVARPDPVDLERLMWEVDAPYEKQLTDGGLQLLARGRSAVVLLVWLADLVAAGRQEVAIE